MNQNYESNYEKVFSYFQSEFVNMDQEAAADKLEFSWDENVVKVPWFGEIWKINRKTGIITDEHGEIPDVTQRLLIMHHLCFFRIDAVHSGKWVPFRQIREAACFERAYKKSAVDPVVKYFSGKTDLFSQAARALGGKPVPYGDAGFQINPLPQIGLQYIFYDRDEEFEASCNILFESTVTWWIHPESVPTIASTTTEKIIQEAMRIEKMNLAEKLESTGGVKNEQRGTAGFEGDSGNKKSGYRQG